MKKKRRKKWLVLLLSILVLLVLTVIIMWRKDPESGSLVDYVENYINPQEQETYPSRFDSYAKEKIQEDLIPVNEYSRPGIELKEVNAIVIHYVGNAGTSAAQNKSYFSNLATTHITKASSHYIVGLEGEIIQCVPLDEISYASNDRNSDTIAIECCHPEADGKFAKATYDSVIKLTAYLCERYGLNPETDVIRHYDVTGKKCPLYYVDHEDAWMQFKVDVANLLKD